MPFLSSLAAVETGEALRGRSHLPRLFRIANGWRSVFVSRHQKRDRISHWKRQGYFSTRSNSSRNTRRSVDSSGSC